MKVIYTYKFLCLCVSVFIITGCTKADIHYPTTETAEGMVVIQPDQSTHTLPAVEYYFYNMDTSKEYMVRACDGRGNFEGIIPVGTYRVIATNTSASNVTFEGMEKHDDATVKAAMQPNRSSVDSSQLTVDSYHAVNNPVDKNTAQPTVKQRSATANYQLSTVNYLAVNYLAAPDKVYSIVIPNLIVSEHETLRYEPQPILLTRTVSLTFSLDEELQGKVTTLSGAMCGVYPSVQLFNGVTSEEEIARSPELLVGYSAEPKENNAAHWNATFTVFGLYDPAYGKNYQNVMSLQLTVDGVIIPVNVDLTDTLSDVLGQFGGMIPVHIPLELEIELVWKDVEVVGIIKPWEGGDGGGTEVPIPTRVEDDFETQIYTD